MNENKKIGQKIKTSRLEAGLTQGDLGRAIGKTGSAIGYLEAGLRRISPDVLKKIADALNKPFIYFYDNEEKDYSAQSQIKIIEKDIKSLFNVLSMDENGTYANIFYRELINNIETSVLFINDDDEIFYANKKDSRKLFSKETIEKIRKENEKEIIKNKQFVFTLKNKDIYSIKPIYEKNGKYLGLLLWK